MSGETHSFVDGLNDAVREHPLAAGLIGLGAAWMIFKGPHLPRNFSGAARTLAGAVGVAGDTAAAATSRAAKAGRRTASSVQGAGAQVMDTVAEGYDAVASQFSDIAGHTTDVAADALEGVKDMAHTTTQAGVQYAASLQRTLSETLEEQPLLLGAIGLVIGAGIASAFPSTQLESDLMGGTGDAVKERIQGLATDAASLATTRAKAVLDGVRDEAKAQGLTPAGAQDALKTAGEKVKAVANTARDAARDRLS